MSYCSQSIEEVLSSLSKAQGKYKPLVATGVTPSGRRYAILSDVISCIKESFEENGLSFYQYTEITEDSNIKLLHTRVGHSSGQFISSLSRVMASNTIKETNTALEVEKRTQALLVLGISPHTDDDLYGGDDDGELESQKSLITSIVRRENPKKGEMYPTISKLDYERIMIEIGNDITIARDIMKEYHIETIADLPRDQYQRVITEVRRIKKLAEEFQSR